MFNMRIEEVTEERDEIKVTTTGAAYVFTKTKKGEVYCYQRLGKKRLLSTLILNASLRDLTLDGQDRESCFLSAMSEFGRIRVNADSLLLLGPGLLMKATFSGDWTPDYSAVEKNSFILVDKNGGMGAYPIPISSNHPELPELGFSFSNKGWRTTISMQGEQKMLISIFPPRPFDSKKSVNDRIVHHFSRDNTKPWDFFPRNSEIKEYSGYGNILVLHVWQKGKLTKTGREIQDREDYIQDAVWCNFHHEALDEKELRRVINKAHQEEMKVLPYLTGVVYPGEPYELVNEAISVMNKYGFDGVYVDGVNHHILQAYTTMRRLRRVLGEKPLYVHVPSPILGDRKKYYVYCPFIDTYADYILRGEHIAAKGDTSSFDWKYLRYVISGYNISNAIGFLCNFDYPPEFTRRLIPQLFKANIRIPYWPGWDNYVKDRQKASGAKYFPVEETNKIIREEYFPVLDALAS